jgi:hypothetical protein
MNVTLTFDPQNATDVAQARQVFDKLTAGLPVADTETIRQKVIALLRGYGHKRIDYIRYVAQASPGTANYDDLVAIVGSAKGLGGTHSAIERNWRAKDMTGPFIETGVDGSARMDLLLADVVLSVIHEIEEPNPLVAASF